MSMTRRLALTAPAAILGASVSRVSGAPAPSDISITFTVEGVDQSAVYGVATKLWEVITETGVPATGSTAGSRFDFDAGKHFTSYSAKFGSAE